MELMSGDTVIGCCGTALPPLEAEEADVAHEITLERVEDEHFITVSREMKKKI